MATPIIVSGDDVSLSVTLKKNAATFVINAASTIKATLVSLDHKTEYLDAEVAQTEVSGSDWANSLVVVAFTSAQTAVITFQGGALLEIEVDDTTNTDGKITFFAEVGIVTGKI